NGSYSDYYELHHCKPAEIQAPAPVRRSTSQSKSKPRVNPQSKPRKHSAEQLEREIHTLEQELAELSEKLANPAADWGPERYIEIGERQSAISSQLEKLYRDWEEATAL
ncbi:MAG TPA: ABC transporter C-terminal domain-containing protein, partial [Blastocatellia bacterium]|nr:ABC transporter C-terminal domain-containing protein [Blastocatellia bacterium]